MNESLTLGNRLMQRRKEIFKGNANIPPHNGFDGIRIVVSISVKRRLVRASIHIKVT